MMIDLLSTDVPDTDGIVVEHVSHAYDGKPVLQDVSLEVRPREIVTLLGPSGAQVTKACKKGCLKAAKGDPQIKKNA